MTILDFLVFQPVNKMWEIIWNFFADKDSVYHVTAK